ncbi:MAG: hypothetical protein H6624_18055 [Bdellovibrionaceae bacterium]|nr:hypothetical protein [Bdellovibrionales bacterium]MCB9086250.1 hypothetical protein [Pseudobdellovibrionaceae bacterium]
MFHLARVVLGAVTLAATGLAIASVQVVPEKLVKTFDGRKATCQGKGDVHRDGGFAYRLFGYDAQMIGANEVSISYSFLPVKCIEKNPGQFAFVSLTESLDTPIVYEYNTGEGKIQVMTKKEDFHFLLWNPTMSAKDAKTASVGTKPGVQKVSFVVGLEEILTADAYQAIWTRGEDVHNRVETFLRWMSSSEGSNGTKVSPYIRAGGSFYLTMKFFRDHAGVLQVELVK